MAQLTVQPVTGRRALRAFVRFPWRIYRDDPNWVPPLISEQLRALDPAHNPFFQQADVLLLMARRGRQVEGTMAAFVDHHRAKHLGEPVGGFGFFEVVDDFSVAARLLDEAAAWFRERGVKRVRGPMNFDENDHPGVLIAGASCPPVMLEAHTPPYYADFLERYGMVKDHDLYAYRVFRSQVGENLEKIPPEVLHVAEAARRSSGATVRKIRLDKWDEEIRIASRLFNVTLSHLPNHVPIKEEDFARLANQFRMFIDPDLALIAEVDGKPVGFCVALPDVNRVLIHLNGRLFPFNWLRLRKLIKQIDVLTFKLMGVLEEYRLRGIDVLLYLEALRAFVAKGYQWFDGSVTSEYNRMANLLARRWGAELYKQFRVYQWVI